MYRKKLWGEKMIKEKIKEYANKIGIEYIGFSSVEFSFDFIERLKERRLNGHLSGFEEKDEFKRVDVSSILSNAKSFISIAVPYRTVDLDYSRPYLSKSSLGIDYHIVLKNKLELLKVFLKEELGAESIYFCDIGPLHDREIAYKCGIGFYGKNTNIYTKKYGSFVFLGELITDLYIEPDYPIESKCGSCDICIKSCPVGAIEKPFYLNSKKCLSFITQKKETLTYDEMIKMGSRIYGCDICQDVCPFNKKAEYSNIVDFKPESWNINIEVERFLTMSNKQFKETFQKTSAGWRGKKVLQRNLIIALANLKSKEGYNKIKSLIEDEYFSYYVKYYLNRLGEFK
ncbi:epoxyqueuosine reductase [Caloramator fervidus]|uniref:Epoxyqueuosine reductase n=2 Tax=Caloramator fervidus TaxID=29344 RepID=A0A1H5SJN5_9CLOT|nr:epoxyqueuosine reductase [Caloramator fervidus]